MMKKDSAAAADFFCAGRRPKLLWETNMRLFVNLLRDENGATAIEYGLIAALISVVIIAAVTLVGSNLQGVFSSIASALAAAS
jgi:pilus assembly protein Flp/PilA